jgi:NADH:ubiquinone oxidoreductase subunit 5 (subunit L)/multisubunit Na+/H+ antiporter MnhA subunit
MAELIILFIGLPLLGFLVSLVIPAKNEKAISYTAFATTGLGVVFIVLFTIWWVINGAPDLNINEITLYQSEHYIFFIDLFFDKVTVVYLLFSSVLSYLIAIYSRYYLHREPGYKRFFNTKLLFITGINLIVLSGNFETLFIGWEVLGVSSFLLIGFYRERYLPTRNALKVYSIYRVADVGLLLAMWLMHHLWHDNITFIQLNNSELVQTQITHHPFIAITICFAIILAASAKSAQFPFSSWLPRAMEGPTPSSAIFYGSVAVHIGVYLLLRTYPFWSSIEFVKWNVIGMGITTAILSAVSAKVQTSVKAQIAYSSITQIGIVFVEVALGFHWLALIHMSGNAFLRAYQLLISPSIVTYLIREQFFNYKPNKKEVLTGRKRIVRNSLFVIGLKEWKLDSLMYKFLWAPLKKIGGWFKFLNLLNVLIFSIVMFSISIVVIITETHIPNVIAYAIPEIFGGIGFVLVLKAFTERKRVFFAWELIILSHFWIAMAVGFNETFSLLDTIFYLGGVVLAGAVGYFFLLRLKRKEIFDLNNFYGHALEHKWLSFGFLVSCLALAGFPITTTFLGQDLLFTHIHENQILLATFVALNFVIVGIALMRMYSRIFLGPHHKSNHPVPLRDA